MNRYSVNSSCHTMRTSMAGDKITLAVGILMALLYFFMYFYTPVQAEDIMFAFIARHLSDADGAVTLQGAFEAARHSWVEENGRVANMLCGPWVVWLPKWLSATLLALFTICMYRCGALLTCGAGSGASAGWRTMAVLWLLTGVLLPWRYEGFIADIVLNYIPPMLLSALFIHLFTGAGDDSSLSGKGICGLVIALTGAWFHEAMAAMMWVGAGVWFLEKRFRLSGAQWVMIFGLLVGSVIVLSSPAMISKATKAAVVGWPPVRQMIKLLPATIILLMTMSCMVMFRSGRRAIKQAVRGGMWPVLMAMGCVGVAVMVKIHFSFTRGAWFGEWYMVLATVCLLREWRLTLKLSGKRPDKWMTAMVACGALFMTILMTVSSVWQARIDRQHQEVLQSVEQSETGTVFRDVIPAPPAWLLGYPYHNTWSAVTTLVAFNHTRDHRILAVVPEVMRNFDWKQAKKIAGDAGLYRYGQHYVMRNYPMENRISPTFNRADEVSSDEVFEFTVDNGETYPIYCSLQKFVPVPGDTIVYVSPSVDKAPAARVQSVSH